MTSRKIRAGHTPMQLHLAPRHGVWVGCSFLPDTPRGTVYSSGKKSDILLLLQALFRC